MSEELSCTQRPFPRTLWRVFGRGTPSRARPLSYGNGKFQTGFRHSPPICISLRCLFRRCRSAVAAAYTVSATFAMQDADAPLRFVLCPYPSLRSPSSLPSSGMGGHPHTTGLPPVSAKRYTPAPRAAPPPRRTPRKPTKPAPSFLLSVDKSSKRSCVLIIAMIADFHSAGIAHIVKRKASPAFWLRARFAACYAYIHRIRPRR